MKLSPQILNHTSFDLKYCKVVCNLGVGPYTFHSTVAIATISLINCSKKFNDSFVLTAGSQCIKIMFSAKHLEVKKLDMLKNTLMVQMNQRTLSKLAKEQSVDGLK